MTSLDAAFGSAGVPMQMGLTVNGQPLESAIGVLVNTIREQQATIAALHETNSQQWERIAALEGAMLQVQGDIGLDQRPVYAYGQPPKPTLVEAFAELERRATVSEGGVKNKNLLEIRTKAEQKIMLTHLRRWILQNRLRSLLGCNVKRFYGRFFGKLKRFVSIQRKEYRDARVLRSLLFTSAKRLVSLYFSHWVKSHVESARVLAAQRDINVDCAERMSSVVNRGIARRYFQKLSMFHAKASGLKQLEQSSSRRLAGGYLLKWTMLELANRPFRSAKKRLPQLIVRNTVVFLRRVLGKWRKFPARKAHFNHLRVVVPRLRNVNLLGTAGHYFSKWMSFVLFARREKAAKGERNQLVSQVKFIATALETDRAAIQDVSDTLNAVCTVLNKTIPESESELRQILDRTKRYPPYAAFGTGAVPPISLLPQTQGTSASAAGVASAPVRRGNPPTIEAILRQQEPQRLPPGGGRDAAAATTDDDEDVSPSRRVKLALDRMQAEAVAAHTQQKLLERQQQREAEEKEAEAQQQVGAVVNEAPPVTAPVANPDDSNDESSEKLLLQLRQRITAISSSKTQ